MEPDIEPTSFRAVRVIVAVCLIFELNAFFLKYVLWIPPPHVLDHVRLALWLGYRQHSHEYYVFITSEEGMHLTKMGANAWLVIAVALVEIMVVVKHRRMFDARGRACAIFWGTFLAVTAGVVTSTACKDEGKAQEERLRLRLIISHSIMLLLSISNIIALYHEAASSAKSRDVGQTLLSWCVRSVSCEPPPLCARQPCFSAANACNIVRSLRFSNHARW